MDHLKNYRAKYDHETLKEYYDGDDIENTFDRIIDLLNDLSYENALLKMEIARLKDLLDIKW